MEAENQTDEDASHSRAQQRERSQIEFPYTDIGQAEFLTKTLYEKGGGSAEPTQLAGWMDQSAAGGTFRSRLSAAKLFGFIDTSRGSVEITDLGRDVIEPSRAPAARVAAFLRVPLFSALYDRFNGYALPPAAAIERQVVELGVSTKQKDRARQVFQKSANLAEFIDPSSGRFVKPATRQQEEKSGETPPADEHSGGKGSGSGGGDGYHPFVQGLLDELPATNEFAKWTLEDQAEWLRAAASIFKLLSKSKGRIEISAKPSKDNSSSDSELL